MSDAMQLAELKAAEDRQLLSILQRMRPVGQSEFSDPRLVNRATRRRQGWRGPVGLHFPAPELQRFIRRHGAVLDIMKASRNRRQSKQAARSLRLARARGLA